MIIAHPWYFQSLAMLNFDVTGIDTNPDLINIAETHKQKNRALDGKSLQLVNVLILSSIQWAIFYIFTRKILLQIF